LYYDNDDTNKLYVIDISDLVQKV